MTSLTEIVTTTLDVGSSKLNDNILRSVNFNFLRFDFILNSYKILNFLELI